MKVSVLFPVCLFLAALSMPASAWAHGGAGIDIDPCAQKVGPYYIHFTAYQPQTDPSGEYCEDVPKAGNTILVFDLVDQELRGKPVAIRVIEAANTPEPRTVLEVAAKTYPNGVVNAEANFDTPGTYLAIVTLKGPENTVSFPIRVEMWSATLVPLFGLLVVGSALYYFIGRQKGWPLPFRGTKAQPKLRLVKSSIRNIREDMASALTPGARTLTTWVSSERPRGRARLVSLLLAFGLVSAGCAEKPVEVGAADYRGNGSAKS